MTVKWRKGVIGAISICVLGFTGCSSGSGGGQTTTAAGLGVVDGNAAAVGTTNTGAAANGVAVPDEVDVLLRAALTDAGVQAPVAPAPPDPNLVVLGEALMFDKLMSGNKDIACATCHSPESCHRRRSLHLRGHERCGGRTESLAGGRAPVCGSQCTTTFQPGRSRHAFLGRTRASKRRRIV